MKYTVEWQELVYDGFDDLENINTEAEFSFEASSADEAKTFARDEAHRKIVEKRKGFESTGTFIPHIVALTAENGVRHRLGRRQTWGVGGFFVADDPTDNGP